MLPKCDCGKKEVLYTICQDKKGMEYGKCLVSLANSQLFSLIMNTTCKC